MIFRKFDPESHDINKLAELVYDVDFRTFDSLFPSKESCVKAIKNRLSYEFYFESDVESNYLFYVFFDDMDVDENKIIGMFNGGKGVVHSFSKSIFNNFKYLKFKEALRLSLVEFMDSFVLVDVKEDDFYIAELAICKSKRGKGYGKEALNQLILLAKDLNCKRVVLDADFRNVGAFRLYESIGFKSFNKKSFGVLGKKRGMYNMEFVLD